MFARWALSVTERHFGAERTDTHDVGFMYGQSSIAGWKALCSGSPAAGRLRVDFRTLDVPNSTRASVCAALRRSGIAAADQLLALARTNPVIGTVPTNSLGPVADTIVDSTMNIGILPWAASVTGNPRYLQVAARHAHEVARVLVRANGSTSQAAYFERRTGALLRVGTHQGLSNTSTWSRGESWAVYGFAQAGAQLHDRSLIAVSSRAAGYVASHLPAGGVPRWDYEAPAGAPLDVSAGVITAAGLERLAADCTATPATCSAPRWSAMARRMLTAALNYASPVPPFGLLRSQVLNEPGSGPGCWCNSGELIFGVSYALEALRLLRVSR
jgi:unsaturated chondroitin disaccharide hydrolase